MSTQRSQFDLSHRHATTFDGGYLIPILLLEVLPGDTFNLEMTAFARLATPIYPIMDNAYLDFFFFFTPCRLLWDNFVKMMGERLDPDDSIDYTVPTTTFPNGASTHGLPDYLGVPIGKTNTVLNAMPLRMYNQLWNQWFRDENLQDRMRVDTDDGPDSYGYYSLCYKRGKRHDYFTSCLPWPQKGDTIQLPLGDTAPITGTIAGDGAPTFDADDVIATQLHTGSGTAVQWASSPTQPDEHAIWNDPALDASALEADLSAATASTINQLREAFQLQRLLERDARGGTRYPEILMSHFGVSDPMHAVLQRPVYLGGGTIPVIVNAVPQTTQKTSASGWDTTEKGSLAAYATAAGGGIGFNQSFTEHGYIMGLVSARADLTYQNNLHKLWSRATRYDFFMPVLANLGEQAVLQQEIYLQDHDATDPANSDVFGYQERWAEYRFAFNRLSGLFRSDAASTLDPWHLAIDFGETPPELDDTFIQDDPPFDRVIAVQTEPHFIFDSWFSIKAARPMPVYSVPGLIDHF